MKTNRTNMNNGINPITRLAASRPKVIIAVVLVTIMALMWVRVLVRSKSDAEAAQTEADSALVNAYGDKQNKQPEIKLSYIELPVVKGRNDCLTRDIFRAQNWKAFSSVTDPDPATGENTGEGSDKYDIYKTRIRQVAKTMTLDLISIGRDGRGSQALIENKLVSVGSKVAVKYNKQTYEFVVTKIEQNKVVLKWENFSITLTMAQPELAE